MELSSEPPFEALVFKYLSFGFFVTINSFFTWVAVLTAALSFWRLRAINSRSHCPPHESEPHLSFHELIVDGSRQTLESLTPSTHESVEEEEEEEEESSVAIIPCASSDSSSAVGDDRNVKGKFFTAYYPVDGDVDGAEDRLMEMEEWGDGEVDGVWLSDDWEGVDRVVAKRTRVLGWYRYQDLTVINGNVVRLWNAVSEG